MDCVICMQKIKDKVSTPCNHEYCRECILQWILKKHNCPVCRSFLTVKSVTGRLTRQGAATMRIYTALEDFVDGPRSLERMKRVFDAVLNKRNRILLTNNKDFREAYNSKVSQAENIYEVDLSNYYFIRD